MTRKNGFRLVIVIGLVAYFLCGLGNAQSFHTAVAKSPQPGTMFIYPERIPLKEGGFFNAERGMMFVRLNRTVPQSDVIGIEFYRFRRSPTADAQAPPIFFLHGGPGFAGLQDSFKRRGNFEDRWQTLLDVSDVVVVGQRGIGSSKPHTLIEQTVPPRAADQPYDEAAAVREIQQVLLREKKAWEELGVDLRGFTVIEAAADVDQIRRALGYETITLWGGSFGSHWSMEIMRRYPKSIARALLWGMEGPDHTYDHPGWIWKVYQRVASEAEASPELKQLIPDGGLVKGMQQLVKQAAEKPIRVPLTVAGRETEVLLDGHAMKSLARGYSGSIQSWPADVLNLISGNYQRAARFLRARTQSRMRRFSTASYWMLDCGSGITPQRLAEFEADPAQQVVGSTYWSYSAGCPVWQSDLGDDFRRSANWNAPTVIVHGTWDLSTPYENALEMAPQFSNSKFVTIHRGSHGALMEAFEANPKFKSDIMQFLADGTIIQLPDSLELPAKKWVKPKIQQAK